MEFLLVLLYFLRIVYKIDEYSCQKCCIFTKHSHIVYLIRILIFHCNKMSDVAASYGKLLDFFAFLCIFIHYWRSFWYVDMPDVTSSLAWLSFWKFQCSIRYSSSNFHKFCGKLMKIISVYYPAVYVIACYKCM